jgi:hypothetical protein
MTFITLVLPPIEKHKVFSVQMLISNTGSKDRSLSIQIAEPVTRQRVIPKVRDVPDIHMDPQGIPITLSRND